MLFRRLIWAALVLALVVGSAQAVLQQWLAVPLILAAEVFEGEPPEAPAPAAAATAAPPPHGAPGHDHAIHHDPALFAAPAAGAATHEAHPHDHDEAAWAPADGTERTFWTWVASVLDSFALALLTLAALAGASLVAVRRATPSGHPLLAGAVVGAMGWISLHLWPTLGLPAELPGMQAADLGSRQTWWLLAVVCAASACALLGLVRAPWRWPVALVLLALPFALGAPHLAGDPMGAFGPEARAQMHALEERFFYVTHTLAATQWLGLGLLGGWLHGRWVRPLLMALAPNPLAPAHAR